MIVNLIRPIALTLKILNTKSSPRETSWLARRSRYLTSSKLIDYTSVLCVATKTHVHSPIQTRSNRQSNLKIWGFQCACDRCSADPHSVSESDSRVEQINEIRKILDNEQHRSIEAEGAKARSEYTLLLVLLFELEGLVTQIMDAYYLAAMELSKIGSRIKAAGYARLGIAHGLPYYGPDEPMVKELIRMVQGATDSKA
jgi:hypothetical protein